MIKRVACLNNPIEYKAAPNEPYVPVSHDHNIQFEYHLSAELRLVIFRLTIDNCRVDDGFPFERLYRNKSEAIEAIYDLFYRFITSCPEELLHIVYNGGIIYVFKDVLDEISRYLGLYGYEYNRDNVIYTFNKVVTGALGARCDRFGKDIINKRQYYQTPTEFRRAYQTPPVEQFIFGHNVVRMPVEPRNPIAHEFTDLSPYITTEKASKRAAEILKANFPEFFENPKREIDIKSKNFDGRYVVTEYNHIRYFTPTGEYVGYLCIYFPIPNDEYRQPHYDDILQKALLCKFDEKQLWDKAFFHPNMDLEPEFVMTILKNRGGKLYHTYEIVKGRWKRHI